MSADTRSVHTDALATLGTIIDDTQKRDAVHVAVIPMQATVRLSPAQPVNAAGLPSLTGTAVGIVDPFLQKPVEPGQRFWLMLMPRTINSLRHVWTHPDFADEPLTTGTVTKADIAASESWLRNFCDKGDTPGYGRVMAVLKGESLRTHDSDDDDYISGRMDHEYIYFSGLDAHGDIPDEFWHHAEIVLGCKLTMRPKYFSCSC